MLRAQTDKEKTRHQRHKTSIIISLSASPQTANITAANTGSLSERPRSPSQATRPRHRRLRKRVDKLRPSGLTFSTFRLAVLSHQAPGILPRCDAAPPENRIPPARAQHDLRRDARGCNLILDTGVPQGGGQPGGGVRRPEQGYAFKGRKGKGQQSRRPCSTRSRTIHPMSSS
ncbi:uncharacterized protein B0I36DRAFT_41990 [Microdochium trichocladiopsis]|uniref:Uncharacterized protein n=1 Tax=Microdochium trichocladiopsis TaxID=1682393 RepID=A0A9P8XSR6_9PEZI|nr:uncharacterized protein B0I36DRAFT_41990 [Microdochium trichocladiopsis]KAH7016066.1 hypothetical protein B0I36DRAFT_41990 [Microdochium trichocladiopsis]